MILCFKIEFEVVKNDKKTQNAIKQNGKTRKKLENIMKKINASKKKSLQNTIYFVLFRQNFVEDTHYFEKY